MNNDEILEVLKLRLTERRFRHTLATAETAVKLAEITGCDVQKAYTAAILHDNAKDYLPEKLLAFAEKYNIEVDEVMRVSIHILHAPVGAALARDEFGIDDEDIITAIASHTTGRVGMSLLEKVIFLADLIEPNRMYPGSAELRELAMKDFDKAMIKAFDRIIIFILDGGIPLHPTTVDARNDLILKGLKK